MKIKQNLKELFGEKNEGASLIAGSSLGIVAGLLVGAIFGNVPLGLIFGVGFGSSLGTAFIHCKNKSGKGKDGGKNA